MGETDSVCVERRGAVGDGSRLMVWRNAPKKGEIKGVKRCWRQG
jgi:hypothetical protein